MHAVLIGMCGGLQSVTIYSSEMSPPQHRGMLNLLFQWCTTIGIIIAQLVNYGTQEIYLYGWRISLAIAAVPALMILFGMLPLDMASLSYECLHAQQINLTSFTVSRMKVVRGWNLNAITQQVHLSLTAMLLC